MKLELTEFEHFHLQEILTKVRTANENSLDRFSSGHVDETRRIEDELKAAKSIYFKIS